MKLTSHRARVAAALVIGLGLASPFTAGATTVRATSAISVTGNRGKPLPENKGEPMDPSRVNRGVPLETAKGHAIPPSSANEGIVVTGNRGEPRPENRGDVTIVSSNYVRYEDSADYDAGCCFSYAGPSRARESAPEPAAAPAVGSVVSSISGNCASVDVDGITYQRCDGTWYEPSFSGTSTVFTVVEPR